MKVIVGLGNPGAEYADTPHNLGFRAVDALAGMLGAAPWRDERRFKTLAAKATHGGETLWLLKPQTFMNASGESVGPFLRYHNAAAADLLVLHDDCDLPPGRLRVRPGGSAGGHNGLKSLITHVGTEAFARVRMGAGRQPGDPRGLIAHVLHRYTPAEALQADAEAAEAARAALCWLDRGLAEAQNRFNAPHTDPEPSGTLSK